MDRRSPTQSFVDLGVTTADAPILGLVSSVFDPNRAGHERLDLENPSARPRPAHEDLRSHRQDCPGSRQWGARGPLVLTAGLHRLVKHDSVIAARPAEARIYLNQT
jgi:hypothetical protein